jgi:hypothetical protein
MCEESGIQVMCVTYSKDGRDVGDTVLFAGRYSRIDGAANIAGSLPRVARGMMDIIGRCLTKVIVCPPFRRRSRTTGNGAT